MPETTIANPNFANGIGEAASRRSTLETTAFPEEQFLEANYQKIGRWKGPLAAQQVQESMQVFWHDLGEAGAAWLVQRVRRETHMDVVFGVASLLADLRAVSIPAILVVLRGEVSPEQALCLLMALNHVQDSDPAGTTDLPLAVIAQFLSHPDFDVREAAVEVVSRCRDQGTRDLLVERRAVEPHSEVLAAIDRALGKTDRNGEAN